jgi:glycine/D-amino acid oxidase-like deaminating enzyme
MEFLEVGVGLRPGSPDNAPIIDRVPGINNVILATGHYRNGILLSSIAGDVIAALVNRTELPADANLVSLDRFTEVTK